MQVKLFDSELKVMEVLWERGETPAKDIAALLAEHVGWSKTTTYTVIKKCVDKGAVTRTDPGFLCKAYITKQQAREAETTELINKMYGGDADQLVASILGRKNLTAEEISQLKQLVNQLK